MKNLEKEYNFIIPRNYLSVVPPSKINTYKVIDKKVIELEDIMLERRGISFIRENSGMRIRKYNNKCEFTYKHFLRRENGMAIYDEFTQDVNITFIDDLLNKTAKMGILKEIYSKGDLYILLTLNNKRTVYLYGNESSQLEVMIEDLTYKSDNKIVRDAMMEIEIHEYDKFSTVIDFVEVLKKLYKAEVTNEGKNKRGLKLLEINLL